MRMLVASAGVFVLMAAVGVGVDAAPPAVTTIAIEDLDCPSCAKKVASKLKVVSGVAKVECDVEQATAAITPQAGKAPSPRRMWEAVEQAGFKPTKLSGPNGVFNTKPRS